MTKQLLILAASCWLAASALTGCSDKAPHISADGALNVEALLNNSTGNLSLENAGYDIAPVCLETTDSSMLPKSAHIIEITDSDIFVSGDAMIYRFDSNGRFKNVIGQKGQGPMEHSRLYSCNIDAPSDRVFINSGNGRILVWTTDGQPVSELTLASDGGYMGMVNGMADGYWAEERKMTDAGYDIDIVWFDESGNRIRTQNILRLDVAESPNYLPAPIVKKDGDVYFIYNNFNSCLYSVTADSAAVVQELDLGNYAPDLNRLGDMDYRNTSRESTAEVLDFYLTESEIGLFMRKGSSFWMTIADRTTGEPVLSHEIDNPRRGGGLKLREGSGMKVLPYYSSGDKIYTLYDAGELDDNDIAWINNRVKSNSSPLSADANPIVIVMERK